MADNSITKQLTSERDTLREELAKLETIAGIREKAEGAREGPDILNEAMEDQAPIGIEARKQENEDYFDNRHDYVRRHIRNLYFDVQDVALRRKLIEVHRSVTENRSKLVEQGVLEAQKELDAGKRKNELLSWVKAGIASTVCIGIGYAIAGKTGAIGGALFGFFPGQKIIEDATANARRNYDDAQRALQAKQMLIQEFELRPSYFIAAERLTGERRLEFDLESAVSNRAAIRNRQKAPEL